MSIWEAEPGGIRSSRLALATFGVGGQPELHEIWSQRQNKIKQKTWLYFGLRIIASAALFLISLSLSLSDWLKSPPKGQVHSEGTCTLAPLPSLDLRMGSGT